MLVERARGSSEAGKVEPGRSEVSESDEGEAGEGGKDEPEVAEGCVLLASVEEENILMSLTGVRCEGDEEKRWVREGEVGDGFVLPFMRFVAQSRPCDRIAVRHAQTSEIRRLAARQGGREREGGGVAR